MFIPNKEGNHVTIETIETAPAHDLEIIEHGRGRAYNYVHVPPLQTHKHISTDLEEK